MGIIVGSFSNKTYKPPLLHRLLKPKILGSTINGLGEKVFRRPSPVYHFRETQGVKLAFRWVQQLFYSRMVRSPNFHERIEERRSNILKHLPDIAAEKVEDSAENWSRKVKEFALAHEADLVGIARMREEWVYDGFEVNEPWIVMEGVAQDYDRIATAPEETSNMEVLDRYNQAHRANFDLATWIRSQGYYAERYKGFLGTSLTMIPPAIEAGLGQLGKHGSLINEKYGPLFRLGYVLTDMPLVADSPKDIHVDDFCTTCKVCTRECPTQAIFNTKQWIRGVEKWYVDFDKCIPYFNDTYGCNVCIAVCPYSRPGVSESLVQKMLRRSQRRDGNTSEAAL